MTDESLHYKLEKIGLKLPEASTPGGNYVSINVRANIAYVAIQFPIINGAYLYQGRLGDKVSSEQGYKAMQVCALNVIAQIEHKISFDNVLGLNHLEAFYQANSTWDDAPSVVDAASDIFVNVFGDRGLHTRSIVGAHQLPRDFCVGLTASFTLNS